MAASEVMSSFVARRQEREVLELAVEGPPVRVVEGDGDAAS